MSRSSDDLLDAYSRATAQKVAVQGDLWRAIDLLRQVDGLISTCGLAAPWPESERVLTGVRCFLDEQRDDLLESPPNGPAGATGCGEAPVAPAGTEGQAS